MSRRPGAPYDDEISADGTTLLYEGHDVRRASGVEPKAVDQPWVEGKNTPSENAKFARAAEKPGEKPLVRVYEKLRPGIWSDKGLFRLTGYRYVLKPNEGRYVFKFEMAVTALDAPVVLPQAELTQVRIIPTAVKQEVFKRDGGRCVICGATDQLHFDHDFPYSKGGTSLSSKNVRILCARHNLSKGARIQ
jgi:hypothetical protein